MIDGHGNDRYNYGDRITIDFSSNIAFNNNANAIIEMLRDNLCAIKNYPDPRAKLLVEKIAQRHSVKNNEILVANGSADAFYIIAHLIATDKQNAINSLILTPAFAEYEDSCRAHNHSLHFSDINEWQTIDYSQYDSVWIGTPNNPDGYRIRMEEITTLAAKYPNCLFVIDRAYNDLSASHETERVGEVSANIILSYSLTKGFGIPGIRLGYVVASSSRINRMNALMPPWSVNALAQVVGCYALDNCESLMMNRSELLAESEYLQQKVASINGFQVSPSDCNFFLCQLQNGRTAAELRQYLIDNYGILIRNASNFRGLTEKHFRLAAQSRADNDKLINALTEWTSTY